MYWRWCKNILWRTCSSGLQSQSRPVAAHPSHGVSFWWSAMLDFPWAWRLRCLPTLAKPVASLCAAQHRPSIGLSARSLATGPWTSHTWRPQMGHGQKPLGSHLLLDWWGYLWHDCSSSWLHFPSRFDKGMLWRILAASMRAVRCWLCLETLDTRSDRARRLDKLWVSCLRHIRPNLPYPWVF